MCLTTDLTIDQVQDCEHVSVSGRDDEPHVNDGRAPESRRSPSGFVDAPA
jgi:hypothetical protein